MSFGKKIEDVALALRREGKLPPGLPRSSATSASSTGWRSLATIPTGFQAAGR